MAIVRWVTSSGSSRNRPAGADSRVVDQDVDGSEFAFDVVEECRERLAVGDVQPRVEPDIEVGAGLFDRRFVDIADRDLRTESVQGLRGGKADTPRPTGDDDDFSVQRSGVCHAPMVID